MNYVLFSLDDPDIFTGEIELLDFVCVGGGKDTGIDGLGIRINDRLVRNIEEVEEITRSSKKVKVEFVFIQSKMRPNFDTKEFINFGNGVNFFFSEQPYLPENDRITEFRKIKDFIFDDEKILSKLKENPSLSLYYVGTGNEPTDEHSKGSLKWLKDEIEKNNRFDSVEIKIVGGKSFIKYCRELENNFEIQINIIDIFPLIVDQKTEVKKAYTFTCKASEFLKILQKEDNSLRRALFNDNVRDYLGDKGTVNSEIEDTIMRDPEMFLLCNNGITIVCSDFDQIRDKLVNIENPQIVNGCQTSSSIFSLKDNPNIEKLQILVRIISTEKLDVSNKIVRGTNKQNQVLDEAFETTLPFHQKTLEDFFVHFRNPSVKIYYERRSKQYNNDPLIKKTEIVNLRILTQTFIAIFLDATYKSHIHEAKLLKEYTKDNENREIFHEEHSPYPYYICALTWYMFEKFFREERINKKYKTYKAHLYRIFRDSVGEFRPKLKESKTLVSYCEKLIKLLEDSQFESQIENVLEVFDTTEKLWTESNSRSGMKDNKKFTDLLIEQSRKKFLQGKTPVNEDERQKNYEGRILNIIQIQRDGVWFGFIKRGHEHENMYFDSRGYVGKINELVPGKKVIFEIGHRERRDFARNVTLAD